MSDNLPALRYSVGDVEVMAKAVADSRMFGMDRAQVMTLMLLAQAKGLHPIQAVERYHVIQGRPAMKADAMLAEFQANGGSVEWGERSNTAWEGTFRHPVHAPKGVAVRFTIEDAKKALLLDNKMWSKYPSNMLRARVISNAIRTVMPGIVAGIYTPEEVSDMVPTVEIVNRDEDLREDGRATINATFQTAPPSRQLPKDTRTFTQLVNEAVGKVNREHAEAFPDAVDVLNVFQVSRHLLREAVEFGIIPDPGKVSQGKVNAILSTAYEGDPADRGWLRRELADYLTKQAEAARETAEAEASGPTVAAEEKSQEVPTDGEEILRTEAGARG